MKQEEQIRGRGWLGLAVMTVVALVPVVTLAQADTTAEPSAKPTRIEERRQAIKEEITERKEELAEKLSQRHQETAARFSRLLAERNKRLTDLYTSHLRRLSAILDKIENHMNRLQEAGAEVDDVNEAIEPAREAISQGMAKVNDQVGKTYTVDLSSAENVGQALKSALQAFREDHTKLREAAIVPAREAVRAALAALSKVAKPEATVTPLATP